MNNTPTAARKDRSSFISHALIKTRRMNQKESFLLEGRLKVLETKQGLKHAEIMEEKCSLNQRLSEIRRVQNQVGISVERRRLLQSRGFTIDTRAAAHESEHQTVLITRRSMPDITEASKHTSGTNSPRVLHTHESEPIIGAFSQMTFQGSRQDEMEKSCEEHRKQPHEFSRSRVPHQFRIIEPPSRQGSRRNFIQVSNVKLKEIMNDEQEHSGKDLLDPNLRLDHRGKILPSNLVRSMEKQRSQSFTERPRADDNSSSTCATPLASYQQTKIHSYDNKLQYFDEVVDSLTKADTDSRKCSPDSRKQAWMDMKDPDRPMKAMGKNAVVFQSKLRSISCEKVDKLGLLDNSQACQDDLSHDKVSVSDTSFAAEENGKGPRKIHAPFKRTRKRAVSDPTTKLALVEPVDSEPNVNKKSTSSVGFSVHQSQQHPQLDKQDGHNTEVRLNDGRSIVQCDSKPTDVNFQSIGGTSPVVQRRIIRRATIPGRFCTMQTPQTMPDSEKGDNEICVPKKRGIEAKLSFSQSPTQDRPTSKQPMRVFSTAKGTSDKAVLVYDARPNQALCKGYVTMQMTVKGRQVKVHIPRFPSDSNDPVLDRVRTKASSDRLQPRLLSEKTDKTIESKTLEN